MTFQPIDCLYCTLTDCLEERPIILAPSADELVIASARKGYYKHNKEHIRAQQNARARESRDDTGKRLREFRAEFKESNAPPA